jgi:NAD(P)-dependent dehydrogenase (short-subunit alcohol dehydrogenase family)
VKVLERFALTGKKALVAGGNQGLGKAFAGALAEAGARVLIVARDAGATRQRSATWVARALRCSRSTPTSPAMPRGW